MAAAPFADLLHYLRGLVRGPASDESDGRLLTRYVSAREELAFAALLRRHGPMVLGVCRRVLGHSHDAEDAFQATFLLLARKAASIRRADSVGSWLHGAAYRIAARARADRTRRRQAERRAEELRPAEPPGLDAAWRELEAVLDEEVQRLPEHHRTPLLLCYLEGRTHEETAAQLGWPVGTVRSRLARARDRLRQRLTRRGLTLSATAFAAVLAAHTASAALPVPLHNVTLEAVRSFVAGGAVSPHVLALVQGASRAMLLSQLKTVAAVFLLGTACAAGVAAYLTAEPLNETAQAPPPPQQADPPKLPAARERLTLKGHEVMVWAAAFTPDGKTLATAAGLYNKPGELILWDVETGRPGARINEERGIRALTFSPDGKTLATADYYRNKVTLRDPATGKALRVLDTPFANNCVVFSPDGKTLFASILNEGVQGVLWDVASGKELRLFSGHTHWSSCAAFSRDGKLLATGSRDQSVKLWDVETGRPLMTLTGHGGVVEFLAFSPDGRTLASACWDKTVKLWEVATGEERATLRGHNNQALSVSFSPDGRTLVTTSGEVLDSPVDVNLKPGEVKLWDVPSREVFASLEGQNGRIWMSCFSPDGRLLATVAEDKTVKIWDVTPRPASKLRDAAEKELAAWWDDLAGADAAKAYRAVWALALARPAVPFLEQRLRPAAPLAAEARQRIERLVADLDSDDFTVREKASAELEKRGEATEPALRKALENNPSLEMRRRIERLREKLSGPETRREVLQALRGVEALELTDTAEARRLLEALAKGGEHARQTRDAAEALKRLSKRAAGP